MKKITLICPKCKGTKFYQVDCWPDSYEDDISYSSDVCEKCELWLDGCDGNWYEDINSWQDTEDAKPYMTEKQYEEWMRNLGTT